MLLCGGELCLDSAGGLPRVERPRAYKKDVLGDIFRRALASVASARSEMTLSRVEGLWCLFTRLFPAAR